jgi:hypothetical protein
VQALVKLIYAVEGMLRQVEKDDENRKQTQAAVLVISFAPLCC